MQIVRTSRFGTDLGDVVIDRPRIKGVLIEKPTTEQFVQAPPIAGAFDTIARIIDHITPERFFVISKVKSDRESLLWLDYHDFYGRTGFLSQNLRFCRERHEKGLISDALPGGSLTHYADDRAEVLSHMPNVACRYHFGPQSQVDTLSLFVPAPTWSSIQNDLA